MLQFSQVKPYISSTNSEANQIEAVIQQILHFLASEQMAIIEASFEEYHTKTCVKFVPRTDETDYIDIQSEQTGCWSYVSCASKIL